MVSHEYKCIFIHIPKCAGTSIELALGHHTDYSGRSRQDHRPMRQLQHPLLPEAVSSVENVKEVLRTVRKRFLHTPNPRNKLAVTSSQYESYFKFSFVRDPWARAYSWYANVMRDDILRKDYGLSTDLTFPDYIKSNAGKDMLKPQTYWLKNYAGLIDMDFIGKFENLADDYRTVCSKLGIETNTLPHVIKGGSDNYRNHYDEPSISIINDVYREEIELFGYSF